MLKKEALLIYQANCRRDIAAQQVMGTCRQDFVGLRQFLLNYSRLFFPLDSGYRIHDIASGQKNSNFPSTEWGLGTSCPIMPRNQTGSS